MEPLESEREKSVETTRRGEREEERERDRERERGRVERERREGRGKEGELGERTPWLPAARSGAPVARSTVKSTANALEYFFLVGRERKGDHERARGT